MRSVLASRAGMEVGPSRPLAIILIRTLPCSPLPLSSCTPAAPRNKPESELIFEAIPNLLRILTSAAAAIQGEPMRMCDSVLPRCLPQVHSQHVTSPALALAPGSSHQAGWRPSDPGLTNPLMFILLCFGSHSSHLLPGITRELEAISVAGTKWPTKLREIKASAAQPR